MHKRSKNQVAAVCIGPRGVQTVGLSRIIHIRGKLRMLQLSVK
jgi:hypothetical protein